MKKQNSSLNHNFIGKHMKYIITYYLVLIIATAFGPTLPVIFWVLPLILLAILWVCGLFMVFYLRKEIRNKREEIRNKWR